MTYLSQTDIDKLKRFSKVNKTPMTHIMREALSARLAVDAPYAVGFNDGIKKIIQVVNNLQAAQMRFPSGMSFAELVIIEAEKHFIGNQTEEGEK